VYNGNMSSRRDGFHHNRRGKGGRKGKGKESGSLDSSDRKELKFRPAWRKGCMAGANREKWGGGGGAAK